MYARAVGICGRIPSVNLGSGPTTEIVLQCLEADLGHSLLFSRILIRIP